MCFRRIRKSGARAGTRTPMALLPLAPQASVSTNFTTRAGKNEGGEHNGSFRKGQELIENIVHE